MLTINLLLRTRVASLPRLALTGGIPKVSMSCDLSSSNSAVKRLGKHPSANARDGSLRLPNSQGGSMVQLWKRSDRSEPVNEPHADSGDCESRISNSALVIPSCCNLRTERRSHSDRIAWSLSGSRQPEQIESISWKVRVSRNSLEMSSDCWHIISHVLIHLDESKTTRANFGRS